MKNKIGKYLIIILGILIIGYLVFLLTRSPIEELYLPNGEIYMTLNTSYKLPIEYKPWNANLSNINYSLDRENIVSISNKKITSINEGEVNLTINVDNISKTIKINVIKENINNGFYDSIEYLTVDEDKIFLNINDMKKINYHLNPINGYIYNISWESRDNNIVTVNDGLVKGNNYGTATITLKINNKIEKQIEVTVMPGVTGISLRSNNMWLKVGDMVNINAKVIPESPIQNIKYQSDNLNIVDVSNEGMVTAKNIGVANITLTTENISETISVQVNPKIGLVNSNGGIWGYVSKKVYNPVRAGLSFFEDLAKKGIGNVSNNIYTYIDNGVTYNYDINKSILKVDNKSLLMRIYYPLNVDLSTLNTFTFLGGIGEVNFDGYFANIDNDTSIIKSSGITILVTVTDKYESFNVQGIIAGTNFINKILNQKSNAINSIGGYSKGGPDAANAANLGNYQKLMIINSKFDNILSKTNLMNKEVYIYSVNNDDMKPQTVETLNYLKNANYQNVTVISNNPEIYNSYSNNFLVINPGSVLGSGHNSKNVTNSNFFMFGNE